MFGLYSLGIATNRDEWTFDFDYSTLTDKVKFFCNAYESEARRFAREKPAITTIGDWVDRTIKWTAELETHLVKGDAVKFQKGHLAPALYRPFVPKTCYYAPIITHRRYQQPQIFPHEDHRGNEVICFSGVGSSKPFHVLATGKIFSLDFLEKTQCLPLYRYTEDGERVSNITRWGIRQFREHYGDEGITAEDIFHYTYAVLHDPAYREQYAVDLLREFPRLPFYQDFAAWKLLGKKLMDLHVDFEIAAPHPLKRVEKSMQASLDGTAARSILRADKDLGVIRVDEQTTLEGVPADAWRYTLGNRSALEWVLDQYKERSPATRPLPNASTPTASPTTRKKSLTSCAASAPSASRP